MDGLQLHLRSDLDARRVPGRHTEHRELSRTALIGWAFVAGQALLLGALVLAPGGGDWTLPDAVSTAADVVVFAGFGLVLVAALRLGRSLTPTPVPVDGGTLTTSGLYRWVRHPIYSGVLLIVIGIALRSESLLRLAIGVATIVFFHVKAAWEEQRLAERYSEYEAYAARTPRFLPRPWR